MGNQGGTKLVFVIFFVVTTYHCLVVVQMCSILKKMGPRFDKTFYIFFFWAGIEMTSVNPDYQLDYQLWCCTKLLRTREI